MRNRRFNVYYIGSIIMLLVMGMVYVRTMQRTGRDIATAPTGQAQVWAKALPGSYRMHTVSSAGPHLGWVRIWPVTRRSSGLEGDALLAFQIDPAGPEGPAHRQGLLVLNDLEGDILVEWYRRDPAARNRFQNGLVRMDGCEALVHIEGDAYTGGTSGDFCPAPEDARFYLHLELDGPVDAMTFELKRFDQETDQLLEEVRYALIKEVPA